MIFGNIEGVSVEEQIAQLIDKPINGDNIRLATKHHKKLNMHVNGVGVVAYLDKIEKYETQAKLELRQQVARSNRAIFSSLLRPFDKVFSAKGGSTDYLLKGAAEKNMIEKMDNVADGLSMRKWVENKWTNKFVTDPNGIIFIEVDGVKAYPTYKAITVIHDYVMKDGTGFEYLILEPDKYHWMKDGSTYYRVVDDKWDYMIEYKGQTVTILWDYTYVNRFGEVPARTNSDLFDPTNDIKASPIDASIELADEYLRDTSIHSIYKFLHGYPIFWAYLPDCPICNGTGKVEGKPCSVCSATGKKLKKDVSDIVSLTIPEGDEQKVSPDVAGYVAPDLPTWSQQVEELNWLYRGLEFTIWGVYTRDTTGERTAFETAIDAQPINDRLNKFTDSAEMVERWAVKMIGRYYSSNYTGASINYGRRFLIEPADMILNKLGEAIAKGLPETTTMYYQKQYYHTEFANNTRQLAKYLKLIDVEPWPFQSIKEVKEMELSDEDYLRKVYYQEWLASLTEEEILTTDKNKLVEKLTNYVKDKSTRSEAV